MAFTAPTAADFKSRFPRFVALLDTTVDIALGEAARMVDDTWTSQADFTLGRMLYAAHILTLDGHGPGAEAQAAQAGTLDFKVMKSGALTLERFDRDEAAGLSVTDYGRRFAELLYKNRGGPVLAVAE